MTTLMEYKTLNNEVLYLAENSLVEKLSVQELIDLILDTDNNFAVVRSRQELINRGKDDIKLRITIKKTCKNAISALEVLLKQSDCEASADKNIIKLYKSRFLNLVSLVDKLQLEWQKYDLFLKR